MILVFCETKDGAIRKPSLEALSEARRLAGDSGVAALFVGNDISGAEEAADFGADTTIKIESPTLSSYSSDLFASAISGAAKAKNATILLLAATSIGKDVAPRVAARLGAGLAADATALCMKDGKLQATRPIYAGKAMATVDFSTEIQIATTRPNVFALAKVPKKGAVETLPAPSDAFKAIVKEIIAKVGEKQDLTEADIIVSGGRGMKDGANFKLLEELAEAFGGVVGASRGCR